MFSGTKIYQLIEDADYDAIEDPVDREKLEDIFFKKGVTVYRCHSCGRLVIEWDDKGVPMFYLPEAKLENASSAEKCRLPGEGQKWKPVQEVPLPADAPSEERHLRELEMIADAAYKAMYDSTAPAACYSDAKAALAEAIGLADKMGRQADVERLSQKDEHLKAVYRSQFYPF
jgi:hypothetical protein